MRPVPPDQRHHARSTRRGRPLRVRRPSPIEDYGRRSDSTLASKQRTEPHAPHDARHVRRQPARPVRGRRRRRSWTNPAASRTPDNLKRWLREPGGREADGPGQQPGHAEPRPQRGADRPARRLPASRSSSSTGPRTTDERQTYGTEQQDGNHRGASTARTHHRDGAAAAPRTRSACSSGRRPTPAGSRWVFTVDHKKIGIMYGVAVVLLLPASAGPRRC